MFQDNGSIRLARFPAGEGGEKTAAVKPEVTTARLDTNATCQDKFDNFLNKYVILVKLRISLFLYLHYHCLNRIKQSYCTVASLRIIFIRPQNL